ncbi:MAG: glycoside hydrolase family 2 protein [Anaerocolumna sp.]
MNEVRVNSNAKTYLIKGVNIHMKTRNIMSLDGDWDFTYERNLPNLENPKLAKSNMYHVKMPVPGYWDDYTDRLKYTDFWSRDCKFNPEFRRIDSMPLGAAKPPDASLPFLLGTGWYKKVFQASKDWGNCCVTLCIGGITLEGWVWLNGKLIGYHLGHLTPFEFNIDEALKPGEENELVIAVSNIREDRIGCSIRGYKGKSAGITRSVFLQVCREARLQDCYVHTTKELDELIWEVQVQEKEISAKKYIRWEIIDSTKDCVIAEGSKAIHAPIVLWKTEIYGLQPWSDRHPKLYTLRFTLYNDDGILDMLEQAFGMRYMDTLGNKLLLNKKPILLRGLTDHAYFPQTCTVPTSRAYYMDSLKILKQLGFNWVRFHTWTPPEECLEAADELGMMLQVEAPNGFIESDWLDILMTCRRHPSVVVYCCGNEVAIDEFMLMHLEQMAAHCKRLAPDSLFNPMEGLRAIEYELDETALGYVNEPYPHNAARLKRLDAVSDVYAPHGALFSYHSLATDDTLMRQRLSIFSQPCLMHEVGINDSYLNLDLEHRYANTRIGADLFSAVRKHMEERGVLKNAALYYQNSCKWMKQIVKYSIEQARRCDMVSGYDLLGAIDCHWHRTGYAVGILNEFYELKAGFTREDVLRFNRESVLLADCGVDRNLYFGEHRRIAMYASLYNGSHLEHGSLQWQLVDDMQVIIDRGEQVVEQAFNGQVTALGAITMTIGRLTSATRLILKARLTSEKYDIENQWDFWAFPEERTKQDSGSDIKVNILNNLDQTAIEFMKEGGRVLLLGGDVFSTLPTTFQIMSGGRVQGNNATVIYDHPITRKFPHEGYCDWQFYSMIEKGATVVFDDLNLPFEPIIEMVSSYKLIRKQASLFEVGVGKGGCVVCTFHIEPHNPAACYLREQIMDYLTSDDFAPKINVSRKQLLELVQTGNELSVDFSTDEGYDDGGHVNQG